MQALRLFQKPRSGFVSTPSLLQAGIFTRTYSKGAKEQEKTETIPEEKGVDKKKGKGRNPGGSGKKDKPKKSKK